MKIYFDMDGTIANLYNVENWLEKLRSFDSSPYMEATPLLNLSSFARLVKKMQKNGIQIGIISWLSKNSNKEYDEAVTEAKKKWLKKHLPSVIFDEIFILSYGTPKSNCINSENFEANFLFDDEEKNRKDWEENGGIAFDESLILDFLRSII